MVEQSLRLGLLAEDSVGLGQLVSQLRNTPHQIAYSVLIRAHSLPLREDVDAWLVGIGEHSEEADMVIDWLHERDIPHLLLDANSKRSSVDNLINKIYETVNASKHGLLVQKKPARVWVLAASTGGPEAVAQFLGMLDTSAQKDAFIYAQHIEAHSLPALMTGVKANTSMSVSYCVSGSFIEAGHVYIVDPLRAFELTPSGRFISVGQPWSGVYQPSINQVIAKVARNYRNRSGALVFSGMGDDGAESSRLMHAVGGQVLIQSFDSCAVDSMPRSVADKVDQVFNGSITELAEKVMEKLSV